MTSTATHQFPNKREFASHIIKVNGGRSWATAINKTHKEHGHRSFVMQASNTVALGVQHGTVSYTYYTAAYGVAWGIETARFAPEIINDLGAMSTRQLLEFIYQLSQECSTIGEVTRYIVNWYLANHPIAEA
jgi:hypothetical protein